jgi:hypothetical protein
MKKGQVVYLHDADRETVDKLVAAHRPTLLALAAANRKRGRSEQATIIADGFMLAAITSRHAKALGLHLPQTTSHVILAMPDDCELAKSICSRIVTDPGPMMLDVDAQETTSC